MNHDELVMDFMREIAKRKLSIWVAKKAFSYVSSLLDLAMNLGVIQGNAAKTIPKSKRYPKGIRRPKGQPSISLEQLVALLGFIKIPRDRIILKILFYCALRRSELFVLKWKDFQAETGGIFYFEIQRSFCSRTHKIKEWDEADEDAEKSGDERKPETEAKKAHFLKAHGRVVLPPTLVADIRGWAQYGQTDATDPESFIFPTRNGICIIPTNWAEDVLKPAAEKIGIPEISYHWFRRGHATVQHHERAADKPIQGQMRHSKAETTRNIYMQHASREQYRAVVDLENTVQGMIDGRKGTA
jgi:integrase